MEGQPAGYLQSLDFCTPFSLTGHPAVVLPMGQDQQGLPFGVQVVARRWDDERLLVSAASLARLTDAFQRPIPPRPSRA